MSGNLSHRKFREMRGGGAEKGSGGKFDRGSDSLKLTLEYSRSARRLES